MSRSLAVPGPGRARAAAVLVAAVAVASLGAIDSASGAPNERGPRDHAEDHHVQGEGSPGGDKDSRRGRVDPSGNQRSAADERGATVRWNNLGTPATLTPEVGEVLATGLPADPTEAAFAYVAANRDVLGLTDAGAESLEVLTSVPMGQGAAVVLRQRFGDLPAGVDGLLSLGIVDGAVVYATSSLARDSVAPAAATLSEAEAVSAAADDAGISAEALERVTEVAVPTPADGVRRAFQVVLIDNTAEHPEAVTSYVDARTGAVLVREDLVDHADDDNPTWEVFPANPPLDYSSTDTRETWCWTPLMGCERVLENDAAELPWDVDHATGEPTFTTIGNAARSAENWFSNNAFSVGTNFATPRPDRNYDYAFTNEWYEERCNPAVFDDPKGNDIDAATGNLFAMHNRMHDWSYNLGFTEDTWNLQQVNRPGTSGYPLDPEQGNAQAGGVSGGPPGFRARDNANQITPPDGVAPITNMYLWQPIAGGFYAPCVDGDYDMSVIGHEYTHAISNRMVAGPDVGISGHQGRAMGESWSDLTAVEYLNEYGFVPTADENPFSVGAYVTGDKEAGIRNYGMNDSPLNYSDVGYDITGPQVHADGEIWSATNFAIREAMIERHGAGDAATQESCADGDTAVEDCPGNRQWAQIMFDSYLFMPSAVSMVDARDAMLAADRIRFGGENQDLLWNVFPSRGLGEEASSSTNNDTDPTPGFSSPFAEEAVVTFKTAGPSSGANARVFVGRYEARSTPVADTNAATPLPSTARLVPGTYEFVVQAPGFGSTRFTETVGPGQVRDVPLNLVRNVASSASGATATGDGLNVDRLIDDTEATNWLSTDAEQPVAGKQVTVDLAGDRPEQVRRVQVSAMLRPADANDPGGDRAGQSRFTALRAFEVLACTASGTTDCTEDADFTSVFTSEDDAFPSVAPRPRAPELILRSFDIPRTSATHLRMQVLTNQCTGAPDYAGDQDDDPRNVTDCTEASTAADSVRAAEFQAFTR